MIDNTTPDVKHNEPLLSVKDCDLLTRTILKGFTEDEQESFILLCQQQSLNPFTKQIYATRRWTKDRTGNKVPTLVPVTSALGLTAIAVRTGYYDGCVITWAGADGIWREEWLSDEFPKAAKCIVYHKQRTHPEIGIARWESYVGRKQDFTTKQWEITDFWARMPDFMIAKCAKAQALRGAFPDQCSNLYITEELQGGLSEEDQVDDEAKITYNRQREAELMKSATSRGMRPVESKAGRPTPAEAAAPAEGFPIPPTPMSAAPVRAADQEPPWPDDLDTGERTVQPPQSDAAAAEEPTGPPVDDSWKYHEIKGLKTAKGANGIPFMGRAVGDLSINELEAIDDRWMTQVRAFWKAGKDINPVQKADYKAFEAALAYHRGDVVDKPF